MSGFDINNPIDFARNVLGASAELLSNFTGTDPSEWDIQEGSYNGIVFHVFESKQDWNGALDRVQDSGGRRLVKYMYPYQDGQTTDDLGRAGESFNFNIIIHGAKYMNGYARLFKELQKPQPGILIHPVRGQIKCKMEDFTITHESSARKAMTIALTMVEHNFNAGSLEEQFDDKSVKSALQSALEAFQEIDAFLLKVKGIGIFIQAVKNDITALLNLFKTNYAKTLRNLNTTFNNTGSNDDIPGLVPVNFGGNQNDDGTQSTTTFQTATSPSDPFQSVPVDEEIAIRTPLTVKELEREVNLRREEINQIISAVTNPSTNPVTQTAAALEFNNEIIDLKATAIRLQNVLEVGKASSRQIVVDFLVPRLMTIREVAFANEISLDRVNEIEEYNQELLSFNYIEEGTILKVPV